MNSRSKGCRGEREAAKYLTSLGFKTERAARNGVDGGDDLICHSLPNVHIEVKRSQAMDVGTKLLIDAMHQSINAAGIRRAVVLWRPNNKPWRITFAMPNMVAVVTASGDDDITHILRSLNGAA